MCNQAVSLVAAEIERADIPTTLQVFLKEAAERVRPPRALWVPFDHGYPLGEPGNRELQLDVIRQTLALLEEPGPGPVLMEYTRQTAAVGSRDVT
jgi:hypothetical protein